MYRHQSSLFFSKLFFIVNNGVKKRPFWIRVVLNDMGQAGDKSLKKYKAPDGLLSLEKTHLRLKESNIHMISDSALPFPVLFFS